MSGPVARPAWLEEIESSLGRRIDAWRPVAGGDIAESYRVELTSGESAFLKRYVGGDTDPGISEAEATGLAWLAEARALRTPEVLGVGPTWLALEWIESAPPSPDYAERLGAGLASLHAAGAPRFGAESDNWIGRLPQSNTAYESWAAFYAECRIMPLRDRARRAGALAARLDERLEALLDGLPELIGAEEPPARLHGDLWSGNVVSDEEGAPCLIDPSTYAGHREIDLAMMRLFGGFPERTFEAYQARHPLSPGAEGRVALYQVYPLLVHVCLFGGHYTAQLEQTVTLALKAS